MTTPDFLRFASFSSPVDSSTIASLREAVFLQWLLRADSCNGMHHGRSSTSEAFAIHHQRWRAVCQAAKSLLCLRNLSSTKNPLQWRETFLRNLQRARPTLWRLRSWRCRQRPCQSSICRIEYHQGRVEAGRGITLQTRKFIRLRLKQTTGPQR